jgi:hypothetical protein
MSDAERFHKHSDDARKMSAIAVSPIDKASGCASRKIGYGSIRRLTGGKASNDCVARAATFHLEAAVQANAAPRLCGVKLI